MTQNPKTCFVVNPLAGIGGPLALKGSDGKAALEALRRGAKLVAPERARRFVEELLRLCQQSGVSMEFLTADGVMGSDYLRGTPLAYRVLHKPATWPTKAEDTKATVTACCREGADIIVFVGGDGTARDVAEALKSVGCSRTPIIGVPAGVKVYSSVFAESPRAAAYVLLDWLASKSLCDGEVVDIDEDAFRKGELKARLYAIVRTPCSRYMVGSTKQPTPAAGDIEENKKAIARYIVEELMENCTLYILGPGSTVAEIARLLGVEKTLLGVDVIHDKRLLARDVDEETLHKIVSRHMAKGRKVKIIVSPIGGQGYIFGRGNQQISPRIIKLVGKNNIIVVATREKIAKLKKLRVDTGDDETDSMLRGYIRVIIDYGEEQVMRVE